MARLALASGPTPGRGRRPAARRGSRSSGGGLRVTAGYLVCLLIASASLLIGSLDLLPEAPVENWRTDTARSPEVPVPDARSRDRPAAPAGLVRVIDGDTLDLQGERIRLANIDAPEMPPKSKCDAEAEGALAATARLDAMVQAGPVTLERTGVDRYGRTLAHVYVDGADAGRTLIAAGLVRPWEGRRRSWCAV